MATNFVRINGFVLAAILFALSLSPLTVEPVLADSVTGAEDVARLSDEEVRRLLLEKLDTTPQDNTDEIFNPAVVAFRFQRNFGIVKQRGTEIVSAFKDFSSLPGRWWAKMTSGRDGRAFGQFIIVFAVAVGLGIYISQMVRHWLRRMASGSTKRSPSDDTSRGLQTLGRLSKYRAGNGSGHCTGGYSNIFSVRA